MANERQTMNGSEDFPTVDREEGTDEMDGTTEAERIADTQPSIADRSSDDMWDLNRKTEVAGSMYDHRAMNLNQKTIADAQAQAVFWQNIEERRLAAKLASQELLERMQSYRFSEQNFWQSLRERQDQHADHRSHQSSLHNQGYNRSHDDSAHARETHMKHNIMAARTVEPTREENLADSVVGAVTQGVESVARAQTDRTQTSAANISELSAARQTADVNVLNTLSELAGIVQTMQTQSATSQAAFQSLTNQVSELVGAVQALQENKKE